MRRKDDTYTFSLFSRHRLPIYGVAALWLLLLHMETQLPARGLWAIPSVLQRFGACGVEIFCLMSGFGLYHSLEKNPSLRSFYAKRLLRVFLPAFIVMAAYCAVRPIRPSEAIGRILFFPYWWGADTMWYVPFILTMYLFYPLLYRLQKRSPRLIVLLVVVSGAFMILGGITGFLTDRLERSWYRIPVFLLGCAFGPMVEGDRRISPAAFWGVVVAGIAALCGLFWLRHIQYAYPYWLRTCFYTVMAMGAICLTAAVANALSGLRAFGAAVYRCLSFMGMISLECYLFFNRLKDLLNLWLPADAPDRALTGDLGALFFTVLGSFLLVRLCASLRNAFSSLPAPSAEDAKRGCQDQPQR